MRIQLDASHRISPQLNHRRTSTSNENGGTPLNISVNATFTFDPSTSGHTQQSSLSSNLAQQQAGLQGQPADKLKMAKDGARM